MESIITACSELVTHFKRCELNSLLNSSLKQLCKTRWNSVHEMLLSIDVNFKQIEDILLERKEYSLYMDKIDQSLLRDTAEILSFFKSASEQLSADQQPTLHLVLPWINKLRASCEGKTTDSSSIKQLKRLLLEQITEKVWLTQLHDISTFLHPLTKNFSVSFDLKLPKTERLSQTYESLFHLTVSFIFICSPTINPNVTRCIKVPE